MADYLQLLIFIIVMVGTPGPANMLLMAVGGRFGFGAALPFIGGVTAGKLILNTLLVFGIYAWLERDPVILTWLKYISAGYMIWLSIGMLRQQPDHKDDPVLQPPGFLAGLIIHPLNPKAWAMVTIALADYGPSLPDPVTRYVVIAGSFMMVQLIFHSLWCYGGSVLIQRLSTAKARLIFQRALALITVTLVVIIVLT